MAEQEQPWDDRAQELSEAQPVSVPPQEISRSDDSPGVSSATPTVIIAKMLDDANAVAAPVKPLVPWPRKHWKRLVALVLVGVLLLIAIPTGIVAYITYRQVQALARDGIQHLEAVKAKLPTSSSDFGTVLQMPTLEGMRADILIAQNDFTQLQTELNQSPLFGLASGIPGIGAKVDAARHLARIGSDVTDIAQHLITIAETIVTIMHRSPLNASAPFLANADLAVISPNIAALAAPLADINAQVHGANLGGLLSASQQAQLTKVLADLPQISTALTTVQQFIGVAPQLLGLNTPATYLIVAMDRSELRPGGGFQGNYALATLRDGRLINQLKLTDTYLLDENNGRCWNPASVIPAPYQSWWIWGCWGLRDSNISADFPTTARYALQEYTAESGQHAQGFIALTPQLIQQLLDLTGPITIGYGYNVKVTSANLEATIHYYQLAYQGAAGTDLPPADQISSKAKRFTSLLGRALLDRLQHVPQNVLLTFARDALDDLKTKDIQVYSTDPAVENFFTSQHIAATMQRGTGDGIFVVDTNLSGKQNTYVQERIADTVQIDPAGMATHTLMLTYTFANPTNAPTYSNYIKGAYRDYVRIYIPPQAIFDHSSDPAISHVASDEPQRSMWAGFLILQENAGPVTITLQWHVPGALAHGQPYQIIIQKQAGNHPTLMLTVTSANAPKPLLAYVSPTNDFLDHDMTFALANPFS
jgi:hypothetical protein